MTSFPSKPRATRISFDIDNFQVELTDGRNIVIPLAYFPRLLAASDVQRNDYIISGGGIGLHWEQLDEDIRVDNLLLGIFDHSLPNTKAA